ncbi:unnamed protein product, partial [Amoebophrya sp. A120]
ARARLFSGLGTTTAAPLEVPTTGASASSPSRRLVTEKFLLDRLAADKNLRLQIFFENVKTVHSASTAAAPEVRRDVVKEQNPRLLSPPKLLNLAQAKEFLHENGRWFYQEKPSTSSSGSDNYEQKTLDGHDFRIVRVFEDDEAAADGNKSMNPAEGTSTRPVDLDLRTLKLNAALKKFGNRLASTGNFF